MRLFLNTSTFISVIQKFPSVKSSPEIMVTNSNEDDTLSLFENTPFYDCQIMELVHVIGFHPATIMDNQKNVVSCIVHKGFRETAKICKDLQELADYHLQCLIDLEQYNDNELNKLESQSYEG